MIDHEDVSHDFVEAFKMLKYPELSPEHRNYLESLYNIHSLTLRTTYLEFKRTLSFVSLYNGLYYLRLLKLKNINELCNLYS
jgi:hypothetical protein